MSSDDRELPCRCGWCGSDPLYVDYHDREWGVPEYDDRALFEKLILDGFQAGLSWIIILRKREAFRKAFAGFEPAKIARFVGTVASARAYLDLQERGGLSKLLWDFYDGVPLQPRRETVTDIPTQTAISEAISKELRSRGFAFCGPTIVYAFLQACGFVNDHLVTCFRHDQVAVLGQRI